MKESLQPGIQFTFSFPVPENRTVPHLLPESPEFQAMPEVLASGFMVGLIEWTCIQAINPHLDWPQEQTVGIGFQLSHVAATPPGLTVTVEVELTRIAVEPGDRFLLCSDGLCVHLGDDEIREVLEREQPSNAARMLVDHANARGGHDNVTVQVVSPRGHQTLTVKGIPPSEMKPFMI